MELATRKVIDRSFTGLGVFSIVLVAASLVVLLAPIVVRGARAFVFRGTVEHRRLLIERFDRGDRAAAIEEVKQFAARRNSIYERVGAFERDELVPQSRWWSLSPEERARQENLQFYTADFKHCLRELLGPHREIKYQVRDLLEATRNDHPRKPTDELDVDPNKPAVPRDQYGATRWDRATVKLKHVLYREAWVPPATPSADGTPQMLEQTFIPRTTDFAGTPMVALLEELDRDTKEILQPRWTFYWGFLTDASIDSHIFGGIWAELLGTLYLTIGAILFAVPMGIISAIYLVEYAGEHWLVGVLRSCVSTLAGVPSIVFGLFGLAFFINAMHVSPHKSVLAGSLTLAILILPLVIRASEEAIRAVPKTYKEAALSVGAGKWRTIVTVILPAALPGILTGVVISMGRAAGETAPIIFTAAVSVGKPLQIWESFTEPTPALPWNVYNLCTEHEAVDEIRHVQYGMVLVLVLLVLLLNGTAIVMRARITRKLKG